MNTCSCLNLILACIAYWQACEISRVLSECDPLANGIDLSLLEHVSPIEWDNVVLYGQYIPDRKLVRQRRRSFASVKIGSGGRLTKTKSPISCLLRLARYKPIGKLWVPSIRRPATVAPHNKNSAIKTPIANACPILFFIFSFPGVLFTVPPITIELPERVSQTRFNLERWAEILADSALAKLPKFARWTVPSHFLFLLTITYLPLPFARPSPAASRDAPPGNKTVSVCAFEVLPIVRN
jgi:hypothetical protein